MFLILNHIYPNIYYFFILFYFKPIFSMQKYYRKFRNTKKKNHNYRL